MGNCDYCGEADHVVMRDEYELALDAAKRQSAAWEQLCHERHQMWQEHNVTIDNIRWLLRMHGCECDCGHKFGEHHEDCAPCLACRIKWAIGDE